MKLWEPVVIIFLAGAVPVKSENSGILDSSYFQLTDATIENEAPHYQYGEPWVKNTVYELSQVEQHQAGPEFYGHYLDYGQPVENQLAQIDGVQNEDGLEERTLPLIPTFDITKITAWISTENLVSFTITVMTTQLFIAIGWFAAGTVWYILALTTEGTPMHKDVMLMQYALEPTEVANNIFRCFATFAFLALMMAIKVLFTIGIPGIISHWKKTTMDDAMKIITAEKFLKITLSRSFGNGFFLILGWGIFTLLLKKKILLLSVANTASAQNASGKKRKKRAFIERSLSPYSSKEVAIMNEIAIEDRFAQVLSKL